jgi:hypothetical protein
MSNKIFTKRIKEEQLEKLRIARIRVQDAKNILKSVGSGLMLTGEISRLNVVSEDLKAIRIYHEAKA